MTSRKHINLFVRNVPSGAMCSSVIHEWAKDKYDSVTVCYCNENELDTRIHELSKLLRLADSEGANPCIHREIIIIDMWPSKQSFNELKLLENTHTMVFSPRLSSSDMVRHISKKHLGFFRSKWIYGYRSMYDSIDDRFDNRMDWKVLKDFLLLRGAEELEHLITAYVHDLKPPLSFDSCDMIDYYYSVFVRRNEHDSNQAECL